MPEETTKATEHTYLRERDVLARLPVSRATWWRLVADNPSVLKPIKLGPRVTVWRASQIEAFVASCVAEAV